MFLLENVERWEGKEPSLYYSTFDFMIGDLNIIFVVKSSIVDIMFH